MGYDGDRQYCLSHQQQLLRWAGKTPTVGRPPDYRKNSYIIRTQNQNLNDSRLIMQLPLPNPFKPGVKLIT